MRYSLFWLNAAGDAAGDNVGPAGDAKTQPILVTFELKTLYSRVGTIYCKGGEVVYLLTQRGRLFLWWKAVDGCDGMQRQDGKVFVIAAVLAIDCCRCCFLFEGGWWV